MNDQVNQEVELLVINDSDEKVELYYANNPKPYVISKIGPRPPYYFNPRYEQEYPII